MTLPTYPQTTPTNDHNRSPGTVAVAGRISRVPRPAGLRFCDERSLGPTSSHCRGTSRQPLLRVTNYGVRRFGKAPPHSLPNDLFICASLRAPLNHRDRGARRAPPLTRPPMFVRPSPPGPMLSGPPSGHAASGAVDHEAEGGKYGRIGFLAAVAQAALSCGESICAICGKKRAGA